MIQRFYIDKIGISIVNMSIALETIEAVLKNGEYNYICVTNSRTCYLANHDMEYCEIQNNSFLTLPDGMPLVWIAHQKGFKDVERVSGPDLINEVLNKSIEYNYSHYFYGGGPETMNAIGNRLKKDYPDIEIKGLISPPFQPIESFKIDELAYDLNRLKPTFFWCGLGAPKQEHIISLLQPKLDSTICIGVGFAFEHFAGNKKRAPKWMQTSGLEGIYNNIYNPYRLKRFLKPFLFILLKFIRSFFVPSKYG